MPNERLEEKEARYRKLVRRLEIAYRELATDDARCVARRVPDQGSTCSANDIDLASNKRPEQAAALLPVTMTDRFVSERVGKLNQEICKIKEELQEISVHDKNLTKL